MSSETQYIKSMDIGIDGEAYHIEGLPFVSASDEGKYLKSNGTWGNIIDLVYPVGSIYMSVSSTSPATLFGGTWEQLKDRFLLGAGDTYSNGDTGGAKSVSYTPAGSVGNHTLTTAEIPSHAHGLNSHKHSVGAHSHGLNSHKHSVGAHSHGLNSHTHGLNGHTHSGPSHSHAAGILTSANATVTNGGYRLRLSTSYAAGSGGNGYTWMYFKSGGTSADDMNYIANSGTGNTGGNSGSTAAASGSTANSSAFDSGAASGSTANSSAFDSGAASGNTANAGSGGAHNHGFTGTAATISTLPPYLVVYMWKRTA